MMILKPVKQKRISDQVFEQIRELIYRGELKPGTKIMPEREMAAALNVSRTSVRNAINRLTTIGLLEQKQGRGTFVISHETAHPFHFAADLETGNLLIADLLEVRMGIECHAASLAAKRADEDDILAMEKSLAAMQKGFESGRSGTDADVSFHMAIAFAAKNPVHTFVMNSFSNYLFHGNRELLKQVYEKDKNADTVLNQHRNIVRHISNRAPARAYEAMKEHIDFFADFVKSCPASFS